MAGLRGGFQESSGKATLRRESRSRTLAPENATAYAKPRAGMPARPLLLCNMLMYGAAGWPVLLLV
jgi:hypothetical protein